MSSTSTVLIIVAVLAVAAVTGIGWRQWRYRQSRPRQSDGEWPTALKDAEPPETATPPDTTPPEQPAGQPPPPPASHPPRPPAAPPPAPEPPRPSAPEPGAPSGPLNFRIGNQVDGVLSNVGWDQRPGETDDFADSRYANASITDLRSGMPWPRYLPLVPGTALVLRVDIGPLSAESQVTGPVPFPDDQLPSGDLVIDVVVSSAHFTVGRDPYPVPARHQAEDAFVLPGDGSPARARNGGTILTFALVTPAQPRLARLRIVYYYRGAVVQSQLLEAAIGWPGFGAGRKPWSLTTDYTAAAALASAAAIPDRPRLAVVLNGDGTGHEIYVRSHRDGSGGVAGSDGSAGPLASAVTELPAAIGDRVREFRRVLASEPIAPATAARSQAQLLAALRTLAPLGWDLTAAVFPGIREILYALNDSPAAVLHVAGLRRAVGARLPGIDVAEALGKSELEQLISRDLPLLYFYCHGERPTAASRETFLGIGNREWVTPPDFMGWVQDAYLARQQRVWDQVRPLVFINACHSAELDPEALFNYVDAFVGAGNAAGVIGTEVKVAAGLAMEFAELFFGELLTPGTTVAAAIRCARMAFLARGNLFGLNYTPYCWADLSLVPG